MLPDVTTSFTPVMGDWIKNWKEKERERKGEIQKKGTGREKQLMK